MTEFITEELINKLLDVEKKMTQLESSLDEKIELLSELLHSLDK